MFNTKIIDTPASAPASPKIKAGCCPFRRFLKSTPQSPQEIYFESRGKCCKKLLRYNGYPNKVRKQWRHISIYIGNWARKLQYRSIPVFFFSVLGFIVSGGRMGAQCNFKLFNDKIMPLVDEPVYRRRNSRNEAVSVFSWFICIRFDWWIRWLSNHMSAACNNWNKNDNKTSSLPMDVVLHVVYSNRNGNKFHRMKRRKKKTRREKNLKNECENPRPGRLRRLSIRQT